MTLQRLNLSIANAYLLRGRRAVLVDTGSPGTVERAKRALEAHGVRPGDVSLILLTHGHSDHAGGAAALRDLFQAPVAVHRGDVAMVRRGDNGAMLPVGWESRFSQRFVDRPFPAFEPDIVFDDLFSLEPFGIDATGFSTPGHSVGSISLLLPGGEAIIGDILRSGLMGGVVLSGRPAYPYFLYDMADKSTVRDSVRRALDAGAVHLHPGHGGPLSRQATERWLEQASAAMPRA